MKLKMLSFLRLAAPSQAPAAPVCAEATERARVPSFDEVYAEQFDYVWRTARRLGVRADELDDVVQDIFIAVHRLLPRYEAGNLRGWLYAIAMRTILHHHRLMRRHAASVTESEAVLEAVPAPGTRSPDASVETNESVRLLESFLDELDMDKRAVLVLAGIEQKPLLEIAEILELNLNTVASRLRAAREQIQQSLARHRARDEWRLK